MYPENNYFKSWKMYDDVSIFSDKTQEIWQENITKTKTLHYLLTPGQFCTYTNISHLAIILSRVLSSSVLGSFILC